MIVCGWITYRSQVEIVEYVAARFPYCRAAVFLLAFVYDSKNKIEPKPSVQDNEHTVESINLCYLPALMISAQQGHLVWISCFEG